jgi:hypothetical protein
MSKKSNATLDCSSEVTTTFVASDCGGVSPLLDQADANRAPDRDVSTASLSAEKDRTIGFRLDAKGLPVPDYPSVVAGKALLLKSLGIDDPKLYGVVLQQLINAACSRHFDVDAMNEMLGLAQSIRPRDQLEAMLALQMAAVHCKSMRFLSKIDRAKTLEEHATYEKTASKLLRTFSCQVEALRKHRHGGSQNIYVKHVHVQAGGQALVGNVSGRAHE